MSSSGNNPNPGGSRSNPNRRRRSTRHFGPPAAADGKTSAPGQKMSDRPQELENKDLRSGQSAGSGQRSRKTTSNQQRQGNPPGRKNSPQSTSERSGQQSRRSNQPQRRQQQSKPQTQGGRSPAESKIKAASRQQLQSEATAQRPARKAQDRPQGQAQKQRVDRWEKQIKAEETLEDIKRENDRIEKEIWLEIAGIHTIKLDL
ncbi:MAG: hypothetical protein GX276_03590 [Clostridiaceae bacterium]|jgi:hypothetical protein|nr:hypothetical protein [Clostridiaceae bacterium]